MPRVVMALVGETNGNPVVLVCPKFFYEAIIQFLVPFAGEELNNGVAPGEEFNTVAPYAVRGVGEPNALRLTSIPGILSQADFFCSGVRIERRKRWSGGSAVFIV